MYPKILITGCGRSGTKFISCFLRRLGVDVQHEKDGERGRADWHAVGWVPAQRERYDIILHQVRAPLPVIASWHTVAARSLRYVQDCIGVPRAAPAIIRSARYWLEWNLIAEHFAQWTYRVEALRQDIHLLDFLDHCGIAGQHAGDPCQILNHLPETTHSRAGQPNYPRLTWADIEAADPDLAGACRQLAKRYGYRESQR